MDSYNVYQLLWIFFVYSFIGWCGEAAMAAVHRRKFVNRGFVSGPICPVYGAGAAAVAVFLPELKDQLFFLFLGGMIVTTFVEYLTGRLLELIFHRKWWDYSDQRFNLDGYVCLKNSAVWGLCSVLMICFFRSAFMQAPCSYPQAGGRYPSLDIGGAAGDRCRGIRGCGARIKEEAEQDNPDHGGTPQDIESAGKCSHYPYPEAYGQSLSEHRRDGRSKSKGKGRTFRPGLRFLQACQPFYPGGFPRRYRGDCFLPGDYWKAHEQEQPGVRTIQHCVGACVRPSDMDPLSV